jgi:hypothetical protein
MNTHSLILQKKNDNPNCHFLKLSYRIFPIFAIRNFQKDDFFLLEIPLAMSGAGAGFLGS